MSTGRMRERKGEITVFYIGLMLGAALVFVALVYASALFKEREALFQKADRALTRTIEAYRQSEDDVTVVMLGNSRLRYATHLGLAPEVDKVERGGKTYHFLQYAENAGNFSLYEPLWPAILASQPDILVIQDQILTAALEETGVLGEFSSALNALLVHMQLSPEEAWRQKRFDFSVHCQPYFDAQALQAQINFIAARDKHVLEGNPILDNARHAVAQALDKGVKVVVLHLPPLSEAITAYGVAAYQFDTYGLDKPPQPRDLFPALYDRIRWAAFDDALPPEMYCDIGHFNDSGREKFTGWFIEYLAGLF